MDSNSFNKKDETVKFNRKSNGVSKESQQATTYGTATSVDVKETPKKSTDEEQNEDNKSVGVVSFSSLFRFANALDYFYMFIGTIASLAHGAAFPLMLLVFGNLTDTFTNRSTDFCAFNFTLLDEFCPPGVHLTPDNFLSEYKKCNFSGLNMTIPDIDFAGNIRKQSYWLIIMGGATIILGYFQVAFWSIACERQTRRLRERLLRAILSKEIAFFDTYKTGQLNTRLNDDVNKVHDGTGDKLGSAFQFTAGFFAGLALGFIKGWKLTLVILSVSPVLFISAVFITKITATMTSQELKSYAKAGAIAEEVLSSIRTVFSYNGTMYESKRYEVQLNAAKKSGIRKGAVNGLLMGIIFCLMFGTYSLGFWYGAKLVREEPDTYSIGAVLIVFFTIITAVFSLGQAAPHFQAMAQARGAAFTLWEIIDTPSIISINNQNGIQKDGLIGAVRFSNVQFVYPSRPDVPVLNGLSFTAQPGQTTALVGTSGCGKSTCMQLLQRFYDPIGGSVEIDDITVDQYNLTWLREHIGVVSQEPVLFHTTIRDNILFGRTTATLAEAQQAAKMANAHDFIMQLPNQYETLVGERGAQLSGGQKQRIAIARALIRDPRILLLDEATSALDTESERVVQDALDRASEGRTTIVIAHRLSTIRNASKIIVLNKGNIVEEGNHQTLMDAQGAYYALVEAQNLRMSEDTQDDEGVKHNEKPTVRVYERGLSNSDHHQYENGIGVKLQESNKTDETTEYSGPSPFLSMLKMNAPETCYILLGFLMCICNGGVQPAFGVILSKVIAVFQICDKEKQEERVLIYIILFAGLGVLMLFSMFLQSFLFAVSGEKLTQRLRARIFRTLLKQEVAYFDQPDNNTGALCTRLATEASDVQGATGIRIGTMLQNFSNLGVGMILAFYYGWSLTLIILGFVPFMIIAGFLQTYMMTGFANKDKGALENAGKVAVESISNIRTVAQLTKERYFGDEYSRLLDIPYRNSLKRAHVFGILFSFSDAIMFFAQAALFNFGAWQVENNRLTFENIMLVMNCILFGAMAVGQTASMSPDYAKAIASSKKILTLFNRVPDINNSSTDGKTLDNFDGQIDLTNLGFRYPNRQEVPVLRNFNLTIEPHQQVALVGSSGCGKSTIIQLLEHFYRPTEGQILIDQNDIASLNLQWWRSQIGFVSQEPILFDASIRENIAYGDTSRHVSMEEIQQAAQSANIQRFIENLPEQYETNVGSKGTQLSGGEKQRIAIARALIRNPKILLLDEATSALDTESERVVQEALDRASQGRTTIVIAHRLSTIQNSDLICVLHRGRIVEAGKHDDLLAQRGFYYRLAQSKK